MCSMASRQRSWARLTVTASTSRFFLFKFPACRTLDASPYAIRSVSKQALRSRPRGWRSSRFAAVVGVSPSRGPLGDVDDGTWPRDVAGHGHLARSLRAAYGRLRRVKDAHRGEPGALPVLEPAAEEDEIGRSAAACRAKRPGLR